jgi:hypothetical protein
MGRGGQTRGRRHHLRVRMGGSWGRRGKTTLKNKLWFCDKARDIKHLKNHDQKEIYIPPGLIFYVQQRDSFSIWSRTLISGTSMCYSKR